MNFVFIAISILLGFWTGIIYSRTASRVSKDELLDEVRKLCNELLKIKNKGTIVITGLTMSRIKGPNRVVVTTLPKEDLQKSFIHERPEPGSKAPTSRKEISKVEVDKVLLAKDEKHDKGCKLKKVYRKSKGGFRE